MFKLILSLIYNRAGLKRWQLEIGTFLLKKGVGWKIGDSIQIPKSKNKITTVYIENMFFDFKNNRINHSFNSNKPVIKNESNR